MKFWESLEKKGRYTTLIGILLSLVMLYKIIVDKNAGIVYLLGLALIIIIFFMLPSKLKIKHKETEIEVED